MTSFRVAALIAPLFLFANAKGEDLIPNGTLANVTWRTGGLPAGMSFHADTDGGPVAAASVSDAAPDAAMHTLCIERTGPKGNAHIQLGSALPVKQGCRYYFSCQVKTTRGASGVFFDFLNSEKRRVSKGFFMDAVSTNPDVQVMANRIELRRCLASQPDGFNTLDVTFTVPEGGSFVSIGLGYSWIVGTAWFGDFQLLPLDLSQTN